MNTAARVARIGTSYPRPGTWAANDEDEDNRLTASTNSLAVVVVAALCIVGAVALALAKS